MSESLGEAMDRFRFEVRRAFCWGFGHVWGLPRPEQLIVCRRCTLVLNEGGYDGIPKWDRYRWAPNLAHPKRLRVVLREGL